jgi:hypothetical protein
MTDSGAWLADDSDHLARNRERQCMSVERQERMRDGVLPGRRRRMWVLCDRKMSALT